MIYLDTSVALAQLLSEDRRPGAGLWRQPLVSSRLLEYEVWTALHREKLAASHGAAARDLLARIAFLELDPEVLARAVEPFPIAVRTRDALHLASALFLRARDRSLRLATFDARLAAAAKALRLPLARI